MAKRINWRLVKQHRTYTVDSTCRLLAVSKGTVRRWVKGGLPALVETRPMLITGTSLKTFLSDREPPRRKCALDEYYCMSCKAARRPASVEIGILSANERTINVQALCEVCGGRMCKRVSRKRITEFEALVRAAAKQRGEPMTVSSQPCLNDNLDEVKSA